MKTSGKTTNIADTEGDKIYQTIN
ncbi:hypothetical protein [uncultured Mucilaginibacter sp.]